MLILAIIIVGFAGLLFINKKDNSNGGNSGNSNGNDNQSLLSEHKTEEGSTGVTVTEYGDFECPSCGQYHPILQQLKEEYAGQVTFQFRHYPLMEIHQNALVASRAAEAAAMQGKFWEMHDMLFENQQAWSQHSSPTSIFEGYAEQIGLDKEKFLEDLRSEQTNAIVQADREEARRRGYQSTPTFEINGERIENPSSAEEFSAKIDEAIEQSNSQE